MKIYNVYIVSNKGQAQALIGENLSEERAEKRVMSGLMRIDRDNYFVGDYEVGSEQDIKFTTQLKK
jgi:uncharacterized protein YjbK